MKLLLTLARILTGLAKELSDESAYERHLASHGRRHSANEWRRFADKRLTLKFVHPRCC
jgi:hypothetical protein